MKAIRTCPICGARLPGDAPRGLCPVCLFAQALSPAYGPRKRAGAKSAQPVRDDLPASGIIPPGPPAAKAPPPQRQL